MTGESVRVTPSWLALREPADVVARAGDLAERVQLLLPPGRTALIHDLGCGTGSMGRWLAPRLAGAQHWFLYDRDPALLELAINGNSSAAAAWAIPKTADKTATRRADTSRADTGRGDTGQGDTGQGDLTRTATEPVIDVLGRAADSAEISVETRLRDITRLDQSDLAGASLITASALLDMLTAAELARFVAACGGAGCPALITLSVTGDVELTPADSLDERVRCGFNAHQRRITGGRHLLGPDAIGAAVDAFTSIGFDVAVRPSPWRLGTAQAGLAAAWFAGWWAAATEQDPALAAHDDYALRRTAQARGGRLSVVVHHHDLLAVPR